MKGCCRALTENRHVIGHSGKPGVGIRCAAATVNVDCAEGGLLLLPVTGQIPPAVIDFLLQGRSYRGSIPSFHVVIYLRKRPRHHIHIVPIGHNGDHGLGRRVTGEVIAPGHPELGGIVGVGNTPVGFTKVLRSVVYLPVPAISWQTHENLLRGHGCNRVIIDALQPAPGGYRAGGAACPRHAIRHNGGRVTVRVEVSINAPVFTAHTALNAGHTGQADVDEFGGIIGFDRLVNSLK